MTLLLTLLLGLPAVAQDDAPPVNELPDVPADEQPPVNELPEVPGDVPGPEGSNETPETRAVGPVPVMDTQQQAPAQAMPGSLWRDVSGRQLLGLQGNARQVGDLVTVIIMESSTSGIGATSSSNKSNDRSGGITSLFGLESGITEANPNMGGTIGFGVGGEANFTGGGNTASNAAFQTVITCTVIDVMPSGNLVVTGTKQFRHYRETQYVTVQGLVRPQDIQMDNTVSSELMANAIIELHGQGSIAERTNPGIGTRVIDAAWPF